LTKKGDATRDRSRDNTKGTFQYLVTYAYTNNNCLLCASNIIVSVAIPTQKTKKRRLQWFGHVEQMEGKRLPNAALHGHAEGKRSRRRTWMDNVREDLKEKNIDLTRIGEATRNRDVWRSLVRASS